MPRTHFSPRHYRGILPQPVNLDHRDGKAAEGAARRLLEPFFGAPLAGYAVTRLERQHDGGTQTTSAISAGVILTTLDYFVSGTRPPRRMLRDAPGSAQGQVQNRLETYIGHRSTDNISNNEADRLAWQAALHGMPEEAVVEQAVVPPVERALAKHAPIRAGITDLKLIYPNLHAWRRLQLRDQWQELKRHLDDGDPWPVALVSDASAPDVIEEQVLAHEYDSPSDDEATIGIYTGADPHGQRVLRLDLRAGTATVGAVADQGATQALAGFYCDAYRPCRPPATRASRLAAALVRRNPVQRALHRADLFLAEEGAMSTKTAVALLATVAFVGASLLGSGFFLGRLTAPAAIQAAAVATHAPSEATATAPPPLLAPAQHVGKAPGIHVSHYQSRITWPAVAKAGITFAYAKATGGTSFVDPEFHNNWHGMREAALSRGAYHIFYPEQAPGLQAEHFVATVKSLNADDLPPAVEILEHGSVSTDELVERARTWLEKVEQKLAKRPIVFSTADFYAAKLAKGLHDYPLWIAEYGVEHPANVGQPWTFWQHSDEGHVAGVDGPVDLALFKGAAGELKSFIAMQAKPSSPHAAAAKADARGTEVATGDARKVRVPGIDVSHYQHTVTWPAVHKDGIAFAYAKATGGIRFVDPDFEKNWAGMRHAGIVRGAYHYFYADEDPEAQAEHFVNTVRSLSAGDLPPVVDVGQRSDIPPKELVGRLRRWIKVVERKLGRRPVIYASADFYKTQLAEGLSDYPLWVAQYGVNVPDETVKPWTFWQYSNRGRLNGVAGAVDRSVFNGSAAALSDFIERSRVRTATAPMAPEPAGAGGTAAKQSNDASKRKAARIESPRKSAVDSTAGRPATYVVTRGETLGEIASRYGMSMQALAKANDIEDADVLETGQVLKIPR